MNKLGPDGAVLAKHEAVSCDFTEFCVESPSTCVVGARDYQVTDAKSVDSFTENYNVVSDGFTRSLFACLSYMILICNELI